MIEIGTNLTNVIVLAVVMFTFIIVMLFIMRG